MRGILYVLSAMAVIGLAFWAYTENYETQESVKQAKSLQSQIIDARARLRVLNAEWAYLNRPDRLRDLAEINFDTLGLLPLQPSQFGRIEQVVFPIDETQSIVNPIDIIYLEASE
jgi:hypothetical protein